VCTWSKVDMTVLVELRLNVYSVISIGSILCLAIVGSRAML
jgi:hypothetical protein